MRVAILAPVAWRCPPAHYGPWEQIASLLAEGLVAQGIEVTLFATLDSLTSAELDGVMPHGYAEHPELDGRVCEAMHVAHAFDRSAEFDLVHSHLDWLPLAFERHCAAPLVTTVHGFGGPAILPAYRAARSALVSISDSDRHPALSYAATVLHGVDQALLPLSTSAGDDLVVLGRIHPDKGIAEAITIARAAGRRLVICGIVHDQRYFAEQVEPHVDGDAVRFLGSVGPQQRAEVLGSAAVLLHPIGFDEPFGLSVVEAMMCGTPVVAYRRGSMPEVVDEGVTGYLVADAEQAALAVPSAVALDRRAVHDRAVARFGAARMVDDYLRVYREVLAGRPQRPPSGAVVRAGTGTGDSLQALGGSPHDERVRGASGA
jgi:glycosyltransferase involved in cell wall biosynthesis